MCIFIKKFCNPSTTNRDAMSNIRQNLVAVLIADACMIVKAWIFLTRSGVHRGLDLKPAPMFHWRL